MLPNLSCKTDGNFNAIIRRLMKEKEEDLGGCHLMDDLLIAKVCDEGGRGNTDGFVVPLECFPKLDDQSGEEQFANLRQFGVDNGGHRSVDRSEWQTGSLSLHDTPAKQTTSADQVLTKKFWNNELDIRHVHLVDKTIDRFLQGFPCHPLILFAGLVRDL